MSPAALGPLPYLRRCDICGKVSDTRRDDYECRYCTEDHNACCRDEELDCCKNCAERIRKGEAPCPPTI